MTTYLHSGGAGDIIYSLPFVRHQGGEVDFLVKSTNQFNKSCNIYRAVKGLLERQPHIKTVSEYDASFPFFMYDPKVEMDVDLDTFRNVMCSSLPAGLPLSYFHANKVATPASWRHPWLEVDPLSPCGTKKFAVISLTQRYRGSCLDWNLIVKMALAAFEKVFFIGLLSEYWEFTHLSRRFIPWLSTADLLEAAQYIAAAEAVYCNQNASLTIAQALGKKCFLDPEPGQKSCMLGLEEILHV